ncbi:MAG: zinc ribbon domain-containing protein [Lentisphaeria bacterium]|nr:zinc ribbon domain-containing protein [Lentisphaeria bacterium]
MPIFRYTCRKCHAGFELLLPRWDAPAKCPACGSEELEKELNRFAAVTKSTVSCPAQSVCPSAGGCGCGGCCGHKH